MCLRTSCCCASGSHKLSMWLHGPGSQSVSACGLRGLCACSATELRRCVILLGSSTSLPGGRGAVFHELTPLHISYSAHFDQHTLQEQEAENLQACGVILYALCAGRQSLPAAEQRVPQSGWSQHAPLSGAGLAALARHHQLVQPGPGRPQSGNRGCLLLSLCGRGGVRDRLAGRWAAEPPVQQQGSGMLMQTDGSTQMLAGLQATSQPACLCKSIDALWQSEP